MTENVRKLVGVVVMAVLVVVGVAVSSGDDTNFTRNSAFVKHDGFRQLPEAQQARLAPAFLQQAAPKAIDTGRLEKTGLIWLTPKPNVTESTGAGNTDKAGIVLQAPGQTKAGIVLQSGGTHALWTGKASVLEGTGLFGKDGKTSFRAGTAVNGKTGNYDNTDIRLSRGRKAGIWLQSGGTEGVADRIAECASGGDSNSSIALTDPIWTVNSLKNVLVTSYIGDIKGESYNCQDLSDGLLPDDTSFPAVVNPDSMKPLLLAACMESKVGAVFLTSHIEASAADCIATVLPALSPDRAKQLDTYWQTQQQLVGTD
jgi:hypothetical protein